MIYDFRLNLVYTPPPIGVFPLKLRGDDELMHLLVPPIFNSH